jgi:hypothetical protein
MVNNSQTGKGDHAQRKNSINNDNHELHAHIDKQEGGNVGDPTIGEFLRQRVHPHDRLVLVYTMSLTSP